MSFTNANAAAIEAKDAFLSDIKEQLSINFANETNKSFEGMKMRLKSANTIAKILNKRLTSVFDTILTINTSATAGKLLSTFYLKMHEMINDSLNCHRRNYINDEKNILKIKDYALRLNKNARKCLDIVYNLMSKINDKNDIPSYDEIVSKHNAVISNYWLRPRKPVNYIEDEDANFDDASDEDYVEEEYNILYDRKFKKVNDIVNYVVNKKVIQRPKRNIPRIDYSGMDEENDDKFDEDYLDIKKDEDDEDDEDEELESCVDYDDDDDDDFVVDYDDDDDKQFVSDYFNDPDYIDTENSDADDDDSEYIPSDEDEFDDDHVLEFDDDDYAEESEEDDDDYEDEDELRKEDLEFLNDYHNDTDYKKENVENDDDSEYIPDAEDEIEDDHVLEFDDDDYAEESEEDDDDYEDSEIDDIEDKQFVSDYFNDPDYEPNEDVDEEDDIELELEAGIANEEDNIKLELEAGIANEEKKPDQSIMDDNARLKYVENLKKIQNEKFINWLTQHNKNKEIYYNKHMSKCC
jgi:hypothetical protein